MLKFHQKGCAAVQKEYFGGVLSEDDFNTVDANNDGEITVDEVIKAAINFFSRSSSRSDGGIGYIVLYSFIFLLFLNSLLEIMAFVGICDADHSWSLTYAEVSSEECAAVQDEYFGGVLSEDDFNTVDADNDGEITVNEVFNAAVDFFSRSTARNDEGIGFIFLFTCNSYHS